MRVQVPVFLCLALLCGVSARSEEPRSLAVSGGISNFNRAEKKIELGGEFRTPIHVWGLAVAAGLTFNDEQSVWIFGGLRRDFALRGPWIIAPAFAITLYEPGDGKDLGGAVVFRSALEIGYEWSSRKRLAFAIYHLSNAGIYDRNPGMNSLILTFSFPL